MRLAIILIVAVLLALYGAYQFYALQIFNALVPKDAGTKLIAAEVAFGPDANQTVDIYAPEKPSGKLPMLLFIHGGSWDSGDKASYVFVGRAFAAKGYVTFVANYRKRPSSTYPAFIEDAALAMAFAQQRGADYGGDSARLYLVAHSAGAYNMMQALLDRRYIEAAEVNEAGLRAIAALAGPYDFLPLDAPASINTFSQVKDLPSTQPINFARGDAPPMLLLYGTADTTVMPRNSIELARRINLAGGKAELRAYKDVGHAGIMLRLAKLLRDEKALQCSRM